VVGIVVTDGRVEARNVGNGPALNLEYTYYRGVCETTSETLPILRVDEWIDGGRESDLFFTQLTKNPKTFEITYESVGGVRYRSEANWTIMTKESPSRTLFKLSISRLN
jgi:hypothetical protein